MASSRSAPNGSLAYTRDGSSSWTRTATWSTANGNPLEPQITIPANGSVASRSPPTERSATPFRDKPPRRRLARSSWRISKIPPDSTVIGGTCISRRTLRATPTVANPGGQEGIGTLLQGYTEQSNVSIVEEFINLIVAQRAYEANSKVVKAADEMYQQVNNLKQ